MWVENLASCNRTRKNIWKRLKSWCIRNLSVCNRSASVLSGWKRKIIFGVVICFELWRLILYKILILFKILQKNCGPDSSSFTVVIRLQFAESINNWVNSFKLKYQQIFISYYLVNCMIVKQKLWPPSLID